jgi:cell division protein FtsA
MKEASAQPTHLARGRPGFAGRVVKREVLNWFVHRRVRERFESVRCWVRCSGVRLDSLLAGVHLTGDCSLLPGICELAEEVFGIRAPRAQLKGILAMAGSLTNPPLTCALGLTKNGSRYE